MSHWSDLVTDSMAHYAACRVNCEALDYCLCPEHGDEHYCDCAEIAEAFYQSMADAIAEDPRS